MVKGLPLALLLALATLASAQAAEFTAAVDRKELALQEHVVLTLSLVNSETRLRAQGVAPNVDLSVLTRDFDVGTPDVENNYNIYRGRGRSTSTLNVDLFPRRRGRLIIPPFTVDGLRTAPIVIEARGLPAGVMPEVFSRGGVSKNIVWQREQVVAWLDVYHRIQLKSASIGEYLSTEPTAIELLEHQDLPQSERTETVKGVKYGVTRIAWALFPKDRGTLTLYLPDVWLVTIDGRKLRLPFQPQQVTVRPLPAAVGEEIPVGKPELAQTEPTPAPSVNELSSWTVTVRGAFSRFALPDTLPLPSPPIGVKIYSDRGQRNDQAGSNGLTAIMSYTLSALPQEGGDFVLPPLRIPYFDPAHGDLEVAELPGPRLRAAATEPAPVAADAAAGHPLPVEGRSSAAPVSLWRTLAVVFAVLWLLTVLRLRHRPWAAASAAAPPQPQPPPALHHPLQGRLLTAFGSRTLEQGLNAWEAAHGFDARLRETVRAVQRVCYGQGAQADAALGHAVDEAINRIRTGASAPAPPGDDCWLPEAFAVEPRQLTTKSG